VNVTAKVSEEQYRMRVVRTHGFALFRPTRRLYAPRFACRTEAHPENAAHASRKEEQMPFKPRRTERATTRFEMRITPAELEQLRADADLAGVTVSELVRRRSLGRAIHAASDMATIRELRRLGGLQKHAISALAQHEEIVDECIANIRSLRSAIERIARDDRTSAIQSRNQARRRASEGCSITSQQTVTRRRRRQNSSLHVATSYRIRRRAVAPR
jgi:hypothetical protein